MPITPTQDQSDPWGWNAWAQTQDPSLYGFTKSAIGAGDLAANKGMLQAAGLWNPAWDAYANYQPNYSDSGNGPVPAAPDLSSLAGYQQGYARGPGNENLYGLWDSSGNLVGSDVSSTQHSPTGSDYATIAGLVGGGALAGGALASAGVGVGADLGGGDLVAGSTFGGGSAGDAATQLSVAGQSTGAAAFPVTPGGAVTSSALSGTGAMVGGAPAQVLDMTGLAATGGMTAGASTAPLDMAAMTGANVTGAASTAASGGLSGILGSIGDSLGNMGIGQWAQLALSGYGLYQGNQLKGMGQNADPFGPYRAQYAQQLQQLMANPSSVTSLPGYQSGLDQATQTLTRQSASQGLTGSGTTAAALANAGANYQGTFFNNYMQQLAGLAGAGSTGANGSMAGYAAGSSLQNQSLANLIKILPTMQTTPGG